MTFESLHKLQEHAKAALFVLLALLAGALLLQALYQPARLEYTLRPALAEAAQTLHEVRLASSSARELAERMKQDYVNNQDNLNANAAATTVLIKSLADTVADSHTQLFGGQDCRPTQEKLPNGWAKLDCRPVAGLFPQSALLLSGAQSWMAQLAVDTHALLSQSAIVLASADAALAPLRADLEKLGELEATLRQEVASNGARAALVADRMSALLDDADRRLQDPALASIVANLDRTTLHGAEVMETLDLSTRGLRRSVGKLRWVLQTLSNYLKGTVRIY